MPWTSQRAASKAALKLRKDTCKQVPLMYYGSSWPRPCLRMHCPLCCTQCTREPTNEASCLTNKNRIDRVEKPSSHQHKNLNLLGCEHLSGASTELHTCNPVYRARKDLLLRFSWEGGRPPVRQSEPQTEQRERCRVGAHSSFFVLGSCVAPSDASPHRRRRAPSEPHHRSAHGHLHVVHSGKVAQN